MLSGHFCITEHVAGLLAYIHLSKWRGDRKEKSAMNYILRNSLRSTVNMKKCVEWKINNKHKTQFVTLPELIRRCCSISISNGFFASNDIRFSINNGQRSYTRWTWWSRRTWWTRVPIWHNDFFHSIDLFFQ